jgi:endonuclease YncB( thermonuclease family)
VDGRTFVLDDGREIRLAAVEVPPMPPPNNAGAAPDGKAAAAALNALAGADQVILRGAEIASDRYGRLVAYAYTMRDGDELFVQGELVADGFARMGTGLGTIAPGNF